MAANFESGVTYGEKSWHGLEENLSAEDVRRFSIDETIKAAKMYKVVVLNKMTGTWMSDYVDTLTDAIRLTVGLCTAWYVYVGGIGIAGWTWCGKRYSHNVRAMRQRGAI